MPKQTKQRKKKSGTKETEKLIKKQRKSIKKKKKKYLVKNWKQYNESLMNRGKVFFYISEEVLSQWNSNPKKKESQKRGRPEKYSDLAIETALIISQVYHLPLRQTEGYLNDIFSKIGSLCKSPDYSTLSLRGKKLSVSIRVRNIRKGNLHVVVDSTGIKVYGEGEWKVRKHGWGKHRTWLKLHLGADENTGEILMGEVTGNDVHDSETVSPMLRQLPKDQEIDQFSGDGAYDTWTCYQALQERDVSKISIPPQKNAKIKKHGNSKGDSLPRDENLRSIREVGRKQWKINSNYHRRSLSETAMFRLKTIFGERVSARTFENQRTHLLLRLKILNRMTLLGMPESYVVE